MILNESESFLELTLVKNSTAYLNVSVLPEPLSPLITIT